MNSFSVSDLATLKTLYGLMEYIRAYTSESIVPVSLTYWTLILLTNSLYSFEYIFFFWDKYKKTKQIVTESHYIESWEGIVYKAAARAKQPVWVKLSKLLTVYKIFRV